MRTVAGMLALAGVGLWMTGCVALDEHRQLEMSHMKLQGEKAEIEQELYDARVVADSLRTKVTSLEGELDTKDQLVANLQAENNRLETAFSSAQETLEALAGRGIPETAVVERTILPEALDSALKQLATSYPDVIEYDARRGTVKWKSDLLFALGSDVVKDSAKASLARFAEIMSSAGTEAFDVIVVGHTDNVQIKRESTRQAHPTNWHLSAHRAIAVSDALQSDGVTARRVGVMGFGEYRPIQPNESEEGRAQNRRVEIHIVPRGSIGSAAHAGL